MRTAMRIITAFALTAAALPAALTVDAGVAQAAACARYRVVFGPAPVHENPSNNSVIRKNKHVGDYVTGPANRNKFDGDSGIWYSAVYTSAATDGEGWMRSAQLSYPMSC
jgi:hypothetical protein